MRALTTLFILVAVLTTGCASSGPLTLEERVNEVIENSSVSRIGIAYYDLSTGTTWLRNEDEVFHAASTMKVPVMMALFRAMEDRRLALDQSVTVTNQFVSIYDGSTFSIPSDQDSDPDLYNHVGQQLPLEELIRRMIVRSSNLATNIVIQLVGADNVMSVMSEIGAEDMKVLRGVEDIKAYRNGMNNTATAHDLMVVLREIASRAASPERTPAMPWSTSSHSRSSTTVSLRGCRAVRKWLTRPARLRRSITTPQSSIPRTVKHTCSWF